VLTGKFPNIGQQVVYRRNGIGRGNVGRVDGVKRCQNFRIRLSFVSRRQVQIRQEVVGVFSFRVYGDSLSGRSISHIQGGYEPPARLGLDRRDMFGFDAESPSVSALSKACRGVSLLELESIAI
jgi:hypothetical protein